MPRPRSQLFVSRLAEPLAGKLASLPDLDDRLEKLVQTAQRAWPEVHHPVEAFIDYLAERLSGADWQAALGELGPLKLLEAIRVADLYLAAACATGNSEALRTFDDQYLSQVRFMLGRMDISGTLLDEVKQTLRQKFFLGDEESGPSITDYSGRGDLK